MRPYLLEARKVPPCTGGKDRESECVAWYQFVWLVAQVHSTRRRSLCASRYPAFYQTQQRSLRSIYSPNGRVRYQLPIRCSTSNGNRRLSALCAPLPVLLFSFIFRAFRDARQISTRYPPSINQIFYIRVNDLTLNVITNGRVAMRIIWKDMKDTFRFIAFI